MHGLRDWAVKCPLPLVLFIDLDEIDVLCEISLQPILEPLIAGRLPEEDDKALVSILRHFVGWIIPAAACLLLARTDRFRISRPATPALAEQG